MDYSIKPDEHQLRKAQQKVQDIVDSYSYSLDLGEVEITLGWEKLERDCTVMHDGDSNLIVIINPDREMEDLEKEVLRGLLELEFLEKAGYDEYSYNWQEVLKLAYTTSRMETLMEPEVEREADLQQKWPEFRQSLSEEAGEFDEDFYMNAAALGEQIGKKLLEKYEIDELPGLKRSDVIEAGDELYG